MKNKFIIQINFNHQIIKDYYNNQTQVKIDLDNQKAGQKEKESHHKLIN